MITAREALALPHAHLSESDREAAESFLRKLDRYVKENVNYSGCDMPLGANEVNGPILAYVGHTCREAGWNWQVQQRQVQSGIIGGQPVAATFFVLRPKEEAYAPEPEVQESGSLTSFAAVLGERFPGFVDGLRGLFGTVVLHHFLDSPILPPRAAGELRATLALVPDGKVERASMVALRFLGRVARAFSGLGDDLDRDELAAIGQFVCAKIAASASAQNIANLVAVATATACSESN